MGKQISKNNDDENYFGSFYLLFCFPPLSNWYLSPAAPITDIVMSRRIVAVAEKSVSKYQSTTLQVLKIDKSRIDLLYCLP